MNVLFKQTIIIFLALFPVIAIAPKSYALDCGSTPSLSNVRGEIRESVREFRSIIYDAQTEVDFIQTVIRVFEDHQTADQNISGVLMMYYGCIFINDLHIDKEYQDILFNDLKVALRQVDRTKPIEKTSLPPSTGGSLTPRRPVPNLTPIMVHPSRGENLIPTKFNSQFGSLKTNLHFSRGSKGLREWVEANASPIVASDASSEPSVGVPENIPSLYSADKYLRPAPIVLLETNSYWVVVAAARTEGDGRTLVRSMKDRFP